MKIIICITTSLDGNEISYVILIFNLIYFFYFFAGLYIPAKKMDSIFVDFGKYNGSSLADIAEKDPGYLVWLKKQPYTNPEIKEAIVDVVDSDAMTFGRYKSKHSVDWVFKNDPMYFNWLLSNKFVRENMKSLYSRVLELHNDSLTHNLQA